MSDSSIMHIAGLTTGMDTDSIITKLMSLERQPETLLQQKGEDYGQQQQVYGTLSTDLQSLGNLVNQFTDVGQPFFDQQVAGSTQATVAEAAIQGYHPANGNYQVQVNRMASAAQVIGNAGLYTAADHQAQGALQSSSAAVNASGQSIDPAAALNTQTANFATSLAASGTVTINGVSINWNDTMSVNDILGQINNSGAGVTASFDAASQTVAIRTQASGSSAQLTLSESAGNLLAGWNLAAGATQGSDAVATSLNAALGNAAVAHLDVAVSSGTFTINGVIFSVNAATDSLQTVLSRINNSGAGVNAVYDAGSGKVSLYQKSEGSAAQIVLGHAGDSSNLLYALKLSGANPPVGGPTDTYAGTDALVSLNNGPAQAFASNTINSLIPGISLTLQGTGNTTVTVGENIDSMVDTFTKFVAQYNAVMDYVNTTTRAQTMASPTTAAERVQGTFGADSFFLDTKDKLSNLIGGVVAGRPGTMNMLAQIGITMSPDNFGKDGKLTLDENKLRAALTQNPDGVAAMLNGSGGIMSKLKTQLNSWTDIVNGSLTQENTSLGSQISDISQRVADMEVLMQAREISLRQEFADMEEAVANMKAQGDRLAQMLGLTTSSSSGSAASSAASTSSSSNGG